MDRKQCTYCSYWSIKNSTLLNHYKFEHAHLPNFKIVCGLSGCTATYNKIPSLQKHMRRKHIDASHQPNNVELFIDEVVEEPQEDIEENPEVDNIRQDSIPSSSTTNDIGNDNCLSMLTKSLLKLREEKGVNESVGEFVIVENSKMMELSLSKCHEVLKTMPHISGKDKSKILQPFNELNSCYRQLSNVYKQRQALQKIGLIEPIEINIGSDSIAFPMFFGTATV